MKANHLISALAACLLTIVPAQAQTKVYVCEGYDTEGVSISNPTDVKFSSDGKTITIGKETFTVADIDSITLTEPQFEAVTVKYSGTSATVTIPASLSKIVKASVSGAHVTLTSTASETSGGELLYVLEGSTSDGSLTLNGNYKLRLHLNGVSITSKKGAAIDIECGKRIEVKVMKGTTNTLVDSSGGSQKAAFYVKGHLELKGKGTLNITGKTKHALCVKEYLQLKSSLGELNILGASNDGIHCGEGDKKDPENSRFTMNGGTLTLSNCGSDCIDADDYGSMFINGGAITMNISQSEGTGLSCDSVIYMTDGTIKLNITGTTSQGIRNGYDAYFDGGTISGTVSGNGSKGFKSKKTTSTTGTVLNGGHAHFRGTDVTLSLSGGTSTDQTKCGGIRVDNNLYQTAGSITITKTNSAAVGLEVKGTDSHTGGTRSIQ